MINSFHTNIAKGGFKLAAFGVKQGGIGSLLAGGFPGLKKTGGVPKKTEPEPAVEPKREVATEEPKPVAATEAASPTAFVPHAPAFTASEDVPEKEPTTEKNEEKSRRDIYFVNVCRYPWLILFNL